MTSIFEVSNVTVRRGQTTMLDDVSLSIPPGQVTALIGPNGAGKTTLLNILSADLEPDAGAVRLQGRDLSSFSNAELSRLRAVLPQQTLLQFGFLAEEVVAMGRLPLPPAGPEDEHAAIRSSMEQTDTQHLRDRVYPKLSGGEQSRVSFSRVLAQETPVVLLDEPTASLDIRHQHDVMRVAREIASHGGTVVAILHDLNLAMTYADQIVLLDRGTIATCGTPWDIAGTSLLSDVFACPLAIVSHPGGTQPLIVSLGCDLPHCSGHEPVATGELFAPPRS